MYTRDISTLGNAVELATTTIFDLTELLPRDSSIITRLESTANKMFKVSDRC